MNKSDFMQTRMSRYAKLPIENLLLIVCFSMHTVNRNVVCIPYILKILKST